MMSNRYYKVVGLEIDSLEARIIEDKNIGDIDDVVGIINGTSNCEKAVWLILPCQCKIE